MKKRSNYGHYIDISGTLRKSNDDIYIGVMMIPDKYEASFREKFYREFPSLKAFSKKGSSLRPDKLKKIIEFMQREGVKMSCVLLKRHVIKSIERDVKAKIKSLKRIQGDVSLRFFEERLMGAVYFEALKQHSRTSYPYQCKSCMETQYNIQEAFVVINRISYKNNFHFRMACAPRRTEHMIKFADFVASAGRKLDKFVLDTYPHFKYVTYVPDENHIDIAFNLSRREKKSRP